MRINYAVLCYFVLTCASAAARSESTPTHRVFDIITNPKIYSMTWDDLLLRLKPLCITSVRPAQEQYKFGNIQCHEDVQVLSLTVSSGDRIGFITATFSGIDKCATFKAIIVRKFGKPLVSKRNCEHEWRPYTPKGKPRRFVQLESSSESNEIFFTIGEDQGP